MNTSDAAKVFTSLLDALFHNDDFQEAFGYHCVDADFVPGTLGADPNGRLLVETGRDNLYPAVEHYEAWDEDTLLDAVELYGQLVSRGDPDHPGSGFHDYAGCGWHYGGFTREPAFSEYRVVVNKILARVGGGFRLNLDGQVERLVDPLISELSTPGADSAPLEADDEVLVQGAIAKFRRRDLASRRDAVRDLADVLERLRAEAPKLMSTKDENALFEIANKFWIRHNKPDQARDYDHDIWWDWIFHLYLASVRLIQGLQARNSGAQSRVDDLVEDLGSMTWRKGLLSERLAEIGLTRLREEDQKRIGRAVGHRCVRETVVVMHDGLDACARTDSLTSWPSAYRCALLEALFVDSSGQLCTVSAVIPMAVRLLLPLPDADQRIRSFVDAAVSRPRTAQFASQKHRALVVDSIRSAVAQLPAGSQRDTWLDLATEIDGAPF